MGSKFENPMKFDEFLQRFVDQCPLSPPSASAKPLLECIRHQRKVQSSNKDKFNEVSLYARFLSKYECIVSSGHEEGLQIEEGTGDLAFTGALMVIRSLQDFSACDACTAAAPSAAATQVR